MTYGEAIVRGKEKMQMKNGVFVIGVRLPPRMNFDKAMKYYGEKLDRYWLSKIELSPTSKFSKQEVLQILKGKNLNGVSDDNG
ncbi:hypothetical protein [Campylobacter concisus]|uniref:hypothetical protein n=1 Tax=Campylobacter concisus TaxID=199 RepID=UPI000CD94F50|nr:hypothetical protein [Campylobacter concisus]